MTSPELSRRVAAAVNTPLGSLMPRNVRLELVDAVTAAVDFDDLSPEHRKLIEELEASA